MTKPFDLATLWQTPRRLDARTTRLLDDSPELLWLHQFAKRCRTRLDLGLEPAAALKAAVLKADIPPAGWRLLTRATPEDILALLQHPNAARRPWSLLMDWIRFHTTFGFSTLYPPAISTVLLDQTIPPLADRLVLWRLPGMYPELLLTALQAESTRRLTDGNLDELAGTELPLVILWVDSDDGKAMLATKKMRWPSLYRAAKRWRAATLAREKYSTTHWTSRLMGAGFGQLGAVPLDNGYLVWEEGFKMRHCLGDLIPLAVRGQSRFFSLRENKSERRIATIEIQLIDGRWALYDMRAVCNRPVGPELLFFGERVAQSYNQAEHFKPEFPIREAGNCGRYFGGQFETLIKNYTRMHGEPPYWIRDMKPDQAYRLIRTSVNCKVPLPTDAEAHESSAQDPSR